MITAQVLVGTLQKVQERGLGMHSRRNQSFAGGGGGGTALASYLIISDSREI